MGFVVKYFTQDYLKAWFSLPNILNINQLLKNEEVNFIIHSQSYASAQIGIKQMALGVKYFTYDYLKAWFLLVNRLNIDQLLKNEEVKFIIHFVGTNRRKAKTFISKASYNHMFEFKVSGKSALCQTDLLPAGVIKSRSSKLKKVLDASQAGLSSSARSLGANTFAIFVFTQKCRYKNKVN